MEFWHGVEITITVVTNTRSLCWTSVMLHWGGADGIFMANTCVTDGAEKVTNEDTHTWIIWWSLSIIEIQVPVVRLERRKCNFPSERQTKECLCGFLFRKRCFYLMSFIYIKIAFLALQMWCQCTSCSFGNWPVESRLFADWFVSETQTFKSACSSV